MIKVMELGYATMIYPLNMCVQLHNDPLRDSGVIELLHIWVNAISKLKKGHNSPKMVTRIMEPA